MALFDFDQHKNFAISSVVVPPTPPSSGTTLDIQPGDVSLFPAVPFNAVVFPSNVAPTFANAEIVRVTNIVGQTLTIEREQEDTQARAIVIGDRIANSITVKALTDIEDAVNSLALGVLSARPILDVGVANQVRAGRVLAATDFTNLLGLTTPTALYNLSNVNDSSGNGLNLTNKGAVTFGNGITGAAGEAAVFTGSTAQALYLADSGSSDPTRLKAGSWGCWFRTAKRGTAQVLLSKADSASNNGWSLHVGTGGYLTFSIGGGGVAGVGRVDDNRWHHGVVTYDGASVSIYVDGVLQFVGVSVSGPIAYAGAYPFNVGGRAADGVTAATLPFFGSLDEAFVTPDVLDDVQVRMLYAAKVAHGFGSTPTVARTTVGRRRRGGSLTTGMFSATPLHLHNFTGGSLLDAGSLGVALTNNNAAVAVAGGDGVRDNAFNFLATSSQYLSSSDAGMPSGTAARSFGCWVKTNNTGTQGVIGWGSTAGSAATEINIDNASVAYQDATGGVNNTNYRIADGQWHFVVAVVDPAPADGLTVKLYQDGQLIASSTQAVGSVTLIGAGGYQIGRRALTQTSYLRGDVDGAFVVNYAMTAEEIASLYAQGSLALPGSPKNAGDHVEGLDATYAYLVCDTLESQHTIDLEVAA